MRIRSFESFAAREIPIELRKEGMPFRCKHVILVIRSPRVVLSIFVVLFAISRT